MMKALHKVSTMETKETIIFTKCKHPFVHKLGYPTKCYINGYMPFVQVVKMEPTYKKMGMGTLFSRRGSHLRLQAIKLLASLI
jgi:hypothetical protein